jgi:hypothetical protein
MSSKRYRNILLFALFHMAISSVYAQEVEHNYLVGPQFTDCDSLTIDSLSTEKAVERIRYVKFRYQQNFKLTRKTGLKSAEFFSCDLHSGFLIVKYDTDESLYSEVGKSEWEVLVSSSDPEGFYLQKKETWRLHQ